MLYFDFFSFFEEYLYCARRGNSSAVHAELKTTGRQTDKAKKKQKKNRRILFVFVSSEYEYELIVFVTVSH